MMVFTAQFGLLLSGTLFQIILNRQFGAEYGGLFALATALALLFSIFVDFGYELIIPRRIAQHHEHSLLLVESIIIKFILWLGGMVTISCTMLSIWLINGANFGSETIIVYCCWVLPRTITMGYMSVFRGLLYTKPIGIIENSLSLAGYTFSIGIIFLPIPAIISLCLVVGVQILAECGKIIWFRKALQQYSVKQSRNKTDYRQEIQRLLSQGLQVLLSKEHWGCFLTQCLSTIEARLGIYLLGAWGTQTDIGYFAAMQRVLSLTRVLPGSVFQGTLPHFSTAISISSFYRLIGFIILLGLTGSIILWAFSEPIILMLYGNNFLGAIPILQVCAWVFLAQMILHTLEALLLASGYTHYVNSLMTIVIGIILIIHIIQPWGISAVTTSYIITIAQYGLMISYLWGIFYIRKKIFY